MQMGYNVLIASDPPSALSIFDKVHVDLVLLDYSFPGHISGDELAHQLRARRPDLPLIMLSGFPDLPASVAESVDLLFLKGSSRPADLLKAIADLLAAPQRPGPAHPAQDPVLLRETNQRLMNKSKELRKHVRRNLPADKG